MNLSGSSLRGLANPENLGVSHLGAAYLCCGWHLWAQDKSKFGPDTLWPSLVPDTANRLLLTAGSVSQEFLRPSSLLEITVKQKWYNFLLQFIYLETETKVLFVYYLVTLEIPRSIFT